MACIATGVSVTSELFTICVNQPTGWWGAFAFVLLIVRSIVARVWPQKSPDRAEVLMKFAELPGKLPELLVRFAHSLNGPAEGKQMMELPNQREPLDGKTESGDQPAGVRDGQRESRTS